MFAIQVDRTYRLGCHGGWVFALGKRQVEERWATGSEQATSSQGHHRDSPAGGQPHVDAHRPSVGKSPYHFNPVNMSFDTEEGKTYVIRFRNKSTLGKLRYAVEYQGWGTEQSSQWPAEVGALTQSSDTDRQPNREPQAPPMKTASFLRTNLVILLLAGLGDSASWAAQQRPIDTTVHIRSTPPGAFVLICPGDAFREAAALPLGEAPLMRLMPLSAIVNSVRITKAAIRSGKGSFPLATPTSRQRWFP